MSRVAVLLETRLNPAFPLSRRELKALCETLLDALRIESGDVTVKLVGDAEIARLNSEFMGCVGPTNILSFPAEDEALGELALSVETMAREADLYGQEPFEHLARLLAHGLLHLAGHDHGAEMFALTDAAVDAALLKRRS